MAILLAVAVQPVRGQEHPPRSGGAPHGVADTARAMGMDDMMAGPLGIPRTREGSGTAWLPDSSPMYALHWRAGAWGLMLHGNVFLQYIDEGSERGDEQLGSVNWIMGMARRPLAGGDITLRAMLSAEPITVGECGYPDLLATGEFCADRGPLHDRQHPHDLFMELAALYERALAEDLAFQVYAAPAGEPALGPAAYPHRPSALLNLFAPINHHWHDATHISFGVLTAGLFGRRWKVEGSVFNGREPDDDRYGIDLAPLDSYGGRVWYLPSGQWTLQFSAANLNEAEQHEPGEPRIDVFRVTASAAHHRPVGENGWWASALVWGRNDEDGAPATHGVLLESTLDLDERHVFFGRAEWVGKTGEELALGVQRLDEEVFTIGKLHLGYLRQFAPLGHLLVGVGAGLSLCFVGDRPEPFYGTRFPVGFAIFGNLRLARMGMGAAHPAPHAPEQSAPGAEPGGKPARRHERAQGASATPAGGVPPGRSSVI
ncbi:MAG TPA: hypothetical protein VF192_13050 [Longimicrobiales bacterium]